jgi:hypothetical protein
MRYEKPQVSAIGAAIQVVQASSKPDMGTVDSILGPRFTVSAYEADE